MRLLHALIRCSEYFLGISTGGLLCFAIISACSNISLVEICLKLVCMSGSDSIAAFLASFLAFPLSLVLAFADCGLRASSSYPGFYPQVSAVFNNHVANVLVSSL